MIERRSGQLIEQQFRCQATSPYLVFLNPANPLNAKGVRDHVPSGDRLGLAQASLEPHLPQHSTHFAVRTLTVPLHIPVKGKNDSRARIEAARRSLRLLIDPSPTFISRTTTPAGPCPSSSTRRTCDKQGHECGFSKRTIRPPAITLQRQTLLACDRRILHPHIRIFNPLAVR